MKKSFLSLAILALPMLAYGAGCDDYPYSDGMSIEDVAGGTKILATATVSVSFDDPDSIRDAKDEAKLLAKAEISKFLSESISSDEAVAKAVNETKSMTGAGKDNVRKEVIDRVKVLRNSSQSLLRGVVQLGDCYTKGQEVRVSVGLKPETIQSAGNAAGSISESVATNPVPAAGMSQPPTSSPSNAASGANKTPLQGVDSYSNTSKLKNF
ncbi:MAG: hypothetical protein WAT23_03760 [Chromatiaceae bacterium]